MTALSIPFRIADITSMSGSPEPDTREHTLETLKVLLKKLTLSCSIPNPISSDHEISTRIPTPAIKATGPPLSLDELHYLFEHLADSRFTQNTAHHAQIGASLTSLRMSGWDMSSQALSIASEIFLEKALPVRVPSLGPKGIITWANAEEAGEDEQGDGYDGSLDLVGTGGDGHDTFNVSTSAAIVAAGVPGVRVCKVST
jgi:anthranilate phosphoribosyltransferase